MFSVTNFKFDVVQSVQYKTLKVVICKYVKYFWHPGRTPNDWTKNE